MNNFPVISVVIPFYQKKPGLLVKCLQSIFDQTYSGKINIIIVDDSSPQPAREELAKLDEALRNRVTLIEQANGGAGSARNKALDNVPADTDYVAFLDSDDSWKNDHIARAVDTLQKGFDAFFSDWWSFNFPDSTNFERIKTITPSEHQVIDVDAQTYELGMTPIEHILSDGGGVIQTSTVVYNFQKFKELRFREEFFNGQDFFFWMDLGEQGAQFTFSTLVGCDNGEGINIYQGSGWGTEHSLRRIRNELFVWVSVNRIYPLTAELRAANNKTIRNLQMGFSRDILHRLLKRKPINFDQFKDIVKMTPSSIGYLLFVPFVIVKEKLIG
jgi:succinoglycan biosynthesis protein ExoW